jgi:hypothetical protein
MAPHRKQTTSLWSVIEKMQRRLEAEGLDRDVVDAAVATGLQALLDFAPSQRASTASTPSDERAGKKAALRLPLWPSTRAPAKA